MQCVFSSAFSIFHLSLHLVVFLVSVSQHFHFSQYHLTCPMPFSATSGSLVRRTGQGVFLLCALTRDRCSSSQDFLIVYFWYYFNIFHIFITSSVVSFSRTSSFSHLPFFHPFVADSSLSLLLFRSLFFDVFSFHIVICFIVGKAHATSLYVSLARWSSGSSYQGRCLRLPSAQRYAAFSFSRLPPPHALAWGGG